MMEEIRNFYIESIAPRETFINPPEVRIKISPLARIDFYVGSALATVFLVQKVAMSIFYLVATFFTCFQNESVKDALRQSNRDVCIFFGAVFVGNLGFFIPQTTNDYLLRIPVYGIVITRPL